jgi:putative inorganic carbon (hco3(-)) transporter
VQELRRQFGRHPSGLGTAQVARSSSGALHQAAIVLGTAAVLGLLTLALGQLPGRLAVLVGIAAIFPFVAMVVGNVRRLLLGICLLDIPLLLDFNLLYQPEPARIGAIGGLTISITTLALTLLYVLWLLSALVHHKSNHQLATRECILFAIYIIAITFSTLIAKDKILALFGVFLWMQMFFYFVYIVSAVRTESDFIFVITFILIGLALESLIIIVSWITGHFGGSSLIPARVEVGGGLGFTGRAVGTLSTPNNAASYLGLAMTVALGTLLANKSRCYNRLAAIGLLLGVPALVLTFSRGGWLAFGIALVIVCLMALRKGWLPIWIPIAMTLMGVSIAVAFLDAVVARLASGSNGRLPLLQLAWAIIQDHPFLGVGINNFAAVIPDYATPNLEGAWIYVVHNTYLLIWSESGIVALFTITTMLFFLTVIGYQSHRSNDRTISSLSLGFSAALTSYMIHLQLDLFNGRTSWQLVLTIGALIIVASRLGNKYTSLHQGCQSGPHPQTSQ